MTTKPKTTKTKKVKVVKRAVVERALSQSVGVRELRQDASRVLDLVKSGEVIVVTERGTPIAEIIPIKRDKLEILMEEGVVTKALRPFDPKIWYRTEGPMYPNGLKEFLKEREEERY
jgi:prevent-host-death family protein